MMRQGGLLSETTTQLAAPQDALITRESDRIFAHAVAEAESLIEQAKREREDAYREAQNERLWREMRMNERAAELMKPVPSAAVPSAGAQAAAITNPARAVQVDWSGALDRAFDTMQRIAKDGCRNSQALTIEAVREFRDAWRNWQYAKRYNPELSERNPYLGLSGCPKPS